MNSEKLKMMSFRKNIYAELNFYSIINSLKIQVAHFLSTCKWINLSNKKLSLFKTCLNQLILTKKSKVYLMTSRKLYAPKRKASGKEIIREEKNSTLFTMSVSLIRMTQALKKVGWKRFWYKIKNPVIGMVNVTF